MRSPPGLQALFISLRDAGIPVGVEEIARLSTIFSMAPSAGEEGLRRILESTLVKSIEERVVFRRVYRHWLETVAKEIERIEERREGGKGAKKARKKAAKARGRRAYADRAIAIIAPAIRMQAPKRERGEGAAREDGESDDESLASESAIPFDGLFDESPAPTRAPLAQAEQQAMAAPKPGFSIAGAEAHPVMKGRDVYPTSQEAMHRPSRGKLLVAAVALALVAGAGWFLLHRGSGDKGDDLHDPNGVNAARNRDAGPAAADSEEHDFDRPELTVVGQDLPSPHLLSFAVLVLALGMGVFIWIRVGSGRWLPDTSAADRRSLARPLMVRGPPPTSRDGLFLAERDEEDLVWGVGRFVSDETGRDLDVARTVDETAAAFGRPVLCYESAEYQREVWLWVDESIDSPVARHLADDLAMMLERSGLPVTRATFWGIPERLRTEGDEIITLDAFDARRDRTAVAILTDGRLMASAHRARNRRGELHTLLRNLSYWPRVTFIDFSPDFGRLSAILEPRGLRVIQPQDAPAALSDLAEGNAPPEYRQLVGDSRVWAAACALTPFAVDDRTALALRRTLNLDISPWTIEYLRECAKSDAGGLTWSVSHRAALLAWLVEAEHLPENYKTLPRGSLLARCTAAWNRILDERERAQRKLAESYGSDWEGCAEAEEIAVERCFIHLWDQPDRAAAALYEHHAGAMSATVHHHLAEMAPREYRDHEDVVVLPWTLRRLRRATQVFLNEMGFGERAKLAGRESMPRPGRLWLAVGLCAGLVLGATGAILEHTLLADKPKPSIKKTRTLPAKIDLPNRPKPDVDENEKPIWSVSVRTPWLREPVRAVARDGENIIVGTAEFPERLRCVETRESMEILRCQSEKAPRQSTSLGGRWSFAILARQNEEKARELAQKLLDSRSADEVFIVPESGIRYDSIGLDQLAPEGSGAAQLLAVVPESEQPDLSDYPGQAVVMSYNQLSSLLGIFYFSENTAESLEQRLRVTKRLGEVDVYQGKLEYFQVMGLGQCGGLGEVCCEPDRPRPVCTRDDLTCKNGKCQREEICSPGERECRDATTAQVCAKDGMSWRPSPCAAGQECVDGICAAAVVCQPNKVECVGDQRRRMCKQDGTGWVEEPCGRDMRCRQGACRRLDCTPGQRECRGKTLMTCEEDGSWRKQRCRDLCLRGNCVMCTPNESRCTRSGKIEFCDPAGSGWQREVSCPARSLCLKNSCRRVEGATVEFSPAQVPAGRLKEIKEIKCTVNNRGWTILALRPSLMATKPVFRLSFRRLRRLPKITVTCKLQLRGGGHMPDVRQSHSVALTSRGGHLMRIPIPTKRPGTDRVTVTVRYRIQLDMGGSVPIQRPDFRPPNERQPDR